MFQLAEISIAPINLQELTIAKMRAYPIKVQKKILKSTRDDMMGRVSVYVSYKYNRSNRHVFLS
jgi:hypothetical protein